MAMLIQKMTLLKSPGSFKSRAFMAEDKLKEFSEALANTAVADRALLANPICGDVKKSAVSKPPKLI